MPDLHWPQPDADTRRAHRAKWFVWAPVVGDFGSAERKRIPHASDMHDPDYDEWDAECSCGQWASEEGGAPRTTVQDLLERHRSDAQWLKDGAMNGVPQVYFGNGKSDPRVFAEGQLGWSRGESVSGRYGVVLIRSSQDGRYFYPANVPEGQRGTLWAELLKVTWQPDPSEPLETGDVFELGSGHVFRHRNATGSPGVGVRPTLHDNIDDEQGGHGWMDAEALHKIRGQLVRLVFVPCQEEGQPQ